MSRVGKHRVVVPVGVVVTCVENTLTIKKGALERIYDVPRCIKVEASNDGILFTPLNQERLTRSMWGTSQRNVSNIIEGFDKGFKVELEMVGVGYKASVNGSKLVMQLGFSHDIEFEIPEGITIVCSKPTSITVSGPCKKQVGEVAVFLRSYRKPEPYKGKGVVRAGEFVYRKEGKKK
ncbi:MAG: 50S ribosomal protein L6 [Holosporales bacterium]|jgi:large subunit ribosomal protein L6|nr:50S ribosomal protein L6 [Holosporales bacterium]